MKNEKNLRITVLVATVVLALLLSSCGGHTEFTYRVAGTASEATVEYTNADGETEETTISLPWEETLAVGNDFSFELTAINTSGSGTVTCEVLVNGDVLGEAEGHHSVECSGSFQKKGSSLTSSFSGTTDPLVKEYINRGIEYINKDQLDEAMAEFQAALELNPGSVNAHGNLGIVYVKQGRYDEGIAEYKEAILLDPDNADAHYNLGLAYRYVDQADEAIAEFEAYLQLAPDAPDGAKVEEWIAELKEQTLGPAAKYSNAEGGYSLLYIEGWHHTESGTQAEFAESEEALDTAGDETLGIMFNAGPLADLAESIGLTDASDAVVVWEAMADSLDVEGGVVESFEIAGYPAAAAAISGTSDDTPFKGAMAIVLVEERIVYSIALAPPGQWAGYHFTFVSMVNSLSFFEPQE